MSRYLPRWVIVLLASLALLPACSSEILSRPTVVILSSFGNTPFQAGDEVRIQSMATDPNGIGVVELLVDEEVVARELVLQPQVMVTVTLKWAATPGSHVLTVRAYNTRDIPSNSPSVRLSVQAVALAPTQVPLIFPAATPTPAATATARQPSSPLAAGGETNAPAAPGPSDPDPAPPDSAPPPPTSPPPTAAPPAPTSEPTPGDPTREPPDDGDDDDDDKGGEKGKGGDNGKGGDKGKGKDDAADDSALLNQIPLLQALYDGIANLW